MPLAVGTIGVLLVVVIVILLMGALYGNRGRW